MKEILSLLPRPSHYLGTEEGSVHKPLRAGMLHCALAFPDLYEVGMSYLGQKILYSILNDRSDILAERVYAPQLETAKLLREYHLDLATLESDTPLGKTHFLGFAITHELCYTNVLYMLDLADIPFRAADRLEAGLGEYPIVAAGGGCTTAAEPLAPFMDLMMLGDGESLLLDVCELLKKARKENWPRSRYLRAAAEIPGVYVPGLYIPSKENPTRLLPIEPDLPRPARRVVADLNTAPYPERQVLPFGAVHNRLSLEIARGCTRGCRFCQAGMLYRPARERGLENVNGILERCLKSTGFDEVSFLALSAGDFSALKALFLSAADRCAAEQISLSLPSLRVGSIDDAIMEKMADIRRTGATLAPEAGSQRLRDIINKGVTEEELIVHVQKLFQHGWQQVKLYFMIGLPGETDDDLLAITDLCRKVRDAAGRGLPRLQVTAALSPFVPKAHTPFQWEGQIPMEEITRRVHLVLDSFKKEKALKMRWHEPAVSFLEGILSRGDRRLADVVEKAYRKGAVFADWMEYFSLDPWLETMREEGLDPAAYTGPRDPEKALAWDHIEGGVSRDFLLKERRRAFEGRITGDCRYETCRHCGACDTVAGPSRLAKNPALPEGTRLCNRLVFSQRDQQAHSPLKDTEGRLIAPPPRHKPTAPPAISAALGVKAARYRIWHTKQHEAAYISQLELQSFLERLLRRADIPMAFSQGFHPMPLLSFGRALPVGVESLAEWFAITLRLPIPAGDIRSKLEPLFVRGMKLTGIEPIPTNLKTVGAQSEIFTLRYEPFGKESVFPGIFLEKWRAFSATPSFLLTRETKKGPRINDIRPLFSSIKESKTGLELTFDWSEAYISPLVLARAVTPDIPLHELRLIKISQHFSAEAATS